jgi:hypothetical protein
MRGIYHNFLVFKRNLSHGFTEPTAIRRRGNEVAACIADAHGASWKPAEAVPHRLQYLRWILYAAHDRGRAQARL